MKIERKTGTEQAIEAIAELRKRYARSPKTRYLMALCYADNALRVQQERENPQPISLVELKERVGKPVWIWSKYHEGGWNIPFDVSDERFMRFITLKCSDVGRQWIEYGLNWLAYDHEPKEKREC